ncbi:hypothetical protein JHK87_052786 [Glycine soja]|nr:hypothetical protein JHK87_052786 [Glycine soja]
MEKIDGSWEVVKKGCEALHRCEDMVNNLGLFSPNKTKEDISTTNLKYILALDLLNMLKKEEEMLSAVKDRQSKDGDKEFSRDVFDERAKKAEAWHCDSAEEEAIQCIQNVHGFLLEGRPLRYLSGFTEVIQGD